MNESQRWWILRLRGLTNPRRGRATLRASFRNQVSSGIQVDLLEKKNSSFSLQPLQFRREFEFPFGFPGRSCACQPVRFDSLALAIKISCMAGTGPRNKTEAILEATKSKDQGHFA